MTQIQVHLIAPQTLESFREPHESGASGGAGTLLRVKTGVNALARGVFRGRMRRQYRALLPDPRWLAIAPVAVNLTGPLSDAMHAPQEEPFELPFCSVTPTDWKARAGHAVRRLACCAAVLATSATLLGAPAHAAPAELNASHGASSDSGSEPPTTRLGADRPRTSPVTQSMTPLRDASGKPVRLGAYHCNIITSHTNNAQITNHTNAWANHANIYSPHLNNWTNHSNVGGGGATHSNILPGDFVF